MAPAARNSGAVPGLVLLSTCERLPEAGGPAGLLDLLPGPLRRLVFFWMAKKALFASGAPWGAIRLEMEEVWSCPPETPLKDVAAAKATDLEEPGRGIRVPTLLLCGTRDTLTPPALSDRLRELIPGSRLRIVEGAGHMVMLEASEQVNRHILDFIGSVAPAEPPRRGAVGGGVQPSVLHRLAQTVRAIWARVPVRRGPSGEGQDSGDRAD